MHHFLYLKYLWIVLTGSFLIDLMLKSNSRPYEEVKTSLAIWGTFFIVIGLFMEPFNGGIKKHLSSFSYWFLTSGFALLGFLIWQIFFENYSKSVVWKSLIRSGQNMLVNYVSIAFLIFPVFELTSVSTIFDSFRKTDGYWGLVKTFVITFLVVVTIYTAKKTIILESMIYLLINY